MTEKDSNPKQSWKWVLVVAVIVCFALSMYFTYTQQTVYLTTTASFTGISAMLLVAYLTFLSMNESTQKTVDSIMESTNQTISTMSQTSTIQLKKFTEIAGHLTISNEKLDDVYKNLEILAKDLLEKKGLKPDLKIFFYESQEKIDLITDKEIDLKFTLVNLGTFSAENPLFDILFPLEIQVINSSTQIIQLDGMGRYANYTLVRRKTMESIEIDYRTYITVTIQIKKGHIGKIVIPYKCSCKGFLPQEGELTINAIG